MSGDRIKWGSGREAVMNAAMTLVAREGLPALTYRALAAEAGVSLGAVRHNFPSIDGLLAVVLDRCLTEALESIGDAADLVELFELVLAAMDENPAPGGFEIRVLIDAQQRPEIMEIAHDFYRGFETFVRSFLEQIGLDASDASVQFVMAFADGMNYQRLVFGPSHNAVMRQQVAGLANLLGLASAHQSSESPSSDSTPRQPGNSVIPAGPSTHD